MKINQRYMKVFILYLISTLVSNFVIKSNNLFKTILQTVIGYTVFAVGLKYLKNIRNK